MADWNGLGQLTDREHEVLTLVVGGRTNPEIARALSISPFTARNHVCHVLAKLNLERRSEVMLLFANRPAHSEFRSKDSTPAP